MSITMNSLYSKVQSNEYNAIKTTITSKKKHSLQEDAHFLIAVHNL